MAAGDRKGGYVQVDASLIVSALGPIVAIVGVYVAMSNRLTALETKMDSLAGKVEKHNNVVERTFKLETEMETAWLRHDELKERVERIEDAKIGGTE